MMVEEIEEYDAHFNTWTVISLQNPSLWIPVEICASIQLNKDKVLIFGGSDAQISDSDFCYTLNVNDYSIERVESLKKAQVFISLPFSYGGNVYAVGNEYYVKTRSLHRFNKAEMTWDLIF
jgi:N-acetylneuraminic acid mutarotase